MPIAESIAPETSVQVRLIPAAKPRELARVHALPTRFTELDGLRGMAAILVILTHYLSGPALYNHAARPRQRAHRTSSPITVDMFFILSGFLVGGILLNTRNSPNYYKTFLFAAPLPRHAHLLSLDSWRLFWWRSPGLLRVYIYFRKAIRVFGLRGGVHGIPAKSLAFSRMGRGSAVVQYNMVARNRRALLHGRSLLPPPSG